jgi:hypothetical protein
MSVKPKNLTRREFCLSRLLILAGGTALSSLPLACSNLADSHDIKTCELHLRRLSLALRVFLTSGAEYPGTLRDLKPYVSHPQVALDSNATEGRSLFVCPATRRLPGNWTDVDRWTNYIYFFGYNGDEHGDLPLLICPPKNHRQKVGLVVFIDGTVRRLSPVEVNELIHEPWHIAQTNGMSEVRIRQLRTKINVRVPGTVPEK